MKLNCIAPVAAMDSSNSDTGKQKYQP